MTTLIPIEAWIVGVRTNVGFHADEPRSKVRQQNCGTKSAAEATPQNRSSSTKFQPGDCLSILMSNGQYAAALVLVADHSNVEYGKNLIGVLDYLSQRNRRLKSFASGNGLF